MPDYAQFLAGKHLAVPCAGFDIEPSCLHPALFPFQRDIVTWALKRGKSAIFADCGLGKTFMQTEFCHQVSRASGLPTLILAPLAVATQTKRKMTGFGYDIALCKSQADVRPGLNIANYERLSAFDPDAFAAVALDESSILKSFTGKIKQALLSAFARTPFRLALTATPAPNDYLELGNHAEFLGVMPSNEMIMRWFINDTMAAGSYRLKAHARKDFWRWVSSWAVSLSLPSDLGYSDDGFELPALEFLPHFVAVDWADGAGEGELFRTPQLNATTMHKEMRLTAPARAARTAELVETSEGSSPWVVWCNTNYEADALMELLPGAVELRGSESADAKERKLTDFSEGRTPILVTKPSIAGYGMDWQHCARMAFVGLSYSYEDLYQALRRSWRFGQTRVVEAHLVMAESEGPVLASIQRKQKEHETMKKEMTEAMRATRLDDVAARSLNVAVERDCATGSGWEMRLGDSCQEMAAMPDNSVGLSVFSPPFSNLYIYSDSVADMGNCAGDAEFLAHFKFLIAELLRVTLPGRLCAVHCKDLPLYKGRDGAAGLRDFPGELTRAFEECGWTYHSKVTIWKDPVIEMQRTKNHGLLYKNLRADSSCSRQGMADYLVVFRKWGGPDTEFLHPVSHTHEEFPLEQWQQWASPVWMDIRQTRVLNYQMAKGGGDERHICPLQLDVIERAVALWSNPGDLVFSPFAGIGSEPYMAVKMGRRALGVELKRSYFDVAVKNLKEAEAEAAAPTLFSMQEIGRTGAANFAAPDPLPAIQTQSAELVEAA